jgi:hypothetical protein
MSIGQVPLFGIAAVTGYKHALPDYATDAQAVYLICFTDV